MRSILCAGLLVSALTVSSLAAAQQPTCDEQLALSNQLLQDLNADRGRVQVESAALKVALGAMQKELKTVKDELPKTEKEGKEK